jgi:hypothetical protein
MGSRIFCSEQHITDEIIMEYIKHQDLEERKKNDNFTHCENFKQLSTADLNLPVLAGSN